MRPGRWRGARGGFTLVELLIGMVILAVIGAGMTKLMLIQSRGFEQQRERIAAQQVSRSAMNLLLSEMRMVDPVGGVVSASRDSVTLRVPYAMGVLCATSGASTVGLFPTDSAEYATSGFSGYAYRDSTSGQYQYVASGAAVAAGTSTPCTSASITMPARSMYVSLAPALPASATVGTPVMLFQRISYAFRSSVILPGRVALWRTVAASGTSEEIAMPFDTSAGFRFYVLDADTAQSGVPSPLSNLRGLELDLAGQSERVARGESQPATAALVTAVFFTNQP
jgi:prepilin-type N-terminal cleavage/methylation domain-containing protein